MRTTFNRYFSGGFRPPKRIIMNRRIALTSADVDKRLDERIERVFMAIGRADGKETVVTISHGGEVLPVVAITMKDLRSLRRYSQSLANSTGKTVRIVSFSSPTLHDILEPAATGDDK
jgi:hypothetical protein